VGTNEILAIDVIRGKVQAGDLFLLCSDGLTDMVEESVLSEVLAVDQTLPLKADQLIERANSAGGHDNITVILGEVAAISE
jgi:protein phosphatase